MIDFLNSMREHGWFYGVDHETIEGHFDGFRQAGSPARVGGHRHGGSGPVQVTRGHEMRFTRPGTGGVAETASRGGDMERPGSLEK